MIFHGNILWLIFGGIIIAIMYYIAVFPFGKEIRNKKKVIDKGELL